MESANLYEHHQQLQPGQLLYSSSLASSSLSSSSSSSSSLGVSALPDWNHSVILDGYEFNRYMTEILPNSPSVKSPLLQEMRFGHVHPPANNELQFENIKGSISDNFLKLSDMNRSSFISYSNIKDEHQDQDIVNLNEKLSWDSSFPKQKLSSSQSYLNGESFARFGVVAPATSRFRSSCMDQNSNLYASSSLISSSTTSPSLQLAADHLLSYTNNKVEGSNQSFEERNSLSYFHVQQSSHSPSNSSNKTSKFRNESSRTEKLSACSSIHEVVPKKPRLSSSSCPTLKVRKEKLGDRIAALHRMVSPFGKTDTASVLTEALGYIQFLQDQIQTLTMSYLKSTRTKSRRNTRTDSTMKDDHHHHQQKEDHEPKIYQDLRSRGLCLVPLSFTSYICSYNGHI